MADVLTAAPAASIAACWFDWSVDQARRFNLVHTDVCEGCYASEPGWKDKSDTHYCLDCWADEIAEFHGCYVIGIDRAFIRDSIPEPEAEMEPHCTASRNHRPLPGCFFYYGSFHDGARRYEFCEHCWPWTGTPRLIQQ